MVAQVPDPTLDALTRFGRHLGMCFQIVDDVLDLTASEDTLGKPAGQDLLEGVYTLPVIYALRDSPELREVLGQPIDHEQLDARAQHRDEQRRGRRRARRRSRPRGEARDALDGAEGLDPEVSEELGRLVDGLVTREC